MAASDGTTPPPATPVSAAISLVSKMDLPTWRQLTRQLLTVERDAEIEEAAAAAALAAKTAPAAGTRTGGESKADGAGVPGSGGGANLKKLTVSAVEVGLFGQTMVTLRPRGGGLLAPHTLGVGDVVAILGAGSTQPGVTASATSSATDTLVTGVVSKLTDSSITISVDSEARQDIDDLEEPLQVSALPNDVTYKRCLTALEDLEQAHKGPAANVVQCVFGDQAPRFGPIRALPVVYNQGLNASQLEAIQFALAAADVAVIHGPPGTGKTTAVVELIRQAVARGDRVLACAPSNIAVDNMLERLAVPLRGSALRLVRFGHPARVTAEVQPYLLDAQVSSASGTQIVGDVKQELQQLLSKLRRASKAERPALRSEQRALRKEVATREAAVVKHVVRNCQVVLATNTGAGMRDMWTALTGEGELRNTLERPFDLVIIDEAAQATAVSCWIPILLGKRVVIAGDHCQLPPTIVSEEAARSGLGVTLMDHLIHKHGDSVVRMLAVQYRMHNTIMGWASGAMYRNMLQSDESVAGRLLADLPAVERCEDTTTPMVWVDTAGLEFREEQDEGGSKRNPEEAEVVMAYVKRLLDTGIAPEQVAVITPYSAQVALLKAEMRESMPKVPVRTVDGFQGQEREAVVLSLVRSNAAGNVGFLADARRMNVAVTRAKRHVAIIGDSDTARSHPFLAGLCDYVSGHGLFLAANLLVEMGMTVPLAASGSASGAAPALVGQMSGKAPVALPTATKERFTPEERRRRFEEREAQRRAQQQRDEARRHALSDIVQAFKAGTDTEHRFPPSLTSWERAVVHELADELGLQHASHGEGKERALVLSKKRVPAPTAAPPQSTAVAAPPAPVAAVPAPAPAAAATPVAAVAAPTQAATPATAAAAAAAAAVAAPTATATPIELLLKQPPRNCPPPPAPGAKKQQDGSAAGGSKKKKGAKAADPVLALVADSKGTDEDAEWALIEAAAAANDRCAAKKCKQGVKIVSSICPYCKLKYCLEHGQAESHGCGDAAHTATRAAWLAQAREPPPSTLKPWQQSALKNELHKKVAEKTTARTAKPKTEQKKKK